MNKLIAIAAVLIALLARASSMVKPCGPTCHAITDDLEPCCADGCDFESCNATGSDGATDGFKCTLGWTKPSPTPKPQEKEGNCERACRAAIMNDGPSARACSHGCTTKFCHVVVHKPRGTQINLGYQCVRA